MAACLLTLSSFAAGGLRAQIQMPNVGRVTTPSEQSQSGQQPKAKNLMTMEELNALVAKFNTEMATARDAFDREKFDDAESGFAQTTNELADTLKKIAVATPPKGFIEFDGVRKPVTVQTETEWFTKILDKARQGEAAAKILRSVIDTQRQAADMLIAQKYPQATDAYKEAAKVLTANRAQFDDATFQFYSTRSENGQRQATTAYWAKEFGRVRDKYNRTTEEPKMSPEEIRRTIQSVADEISNASYTDPAKHPDMPEDARALFQTLLDAARQFLASQ